MVQRVVLAETDAVDEVSVVIADDDLLADLNARYRNLPRTTDVLAFPMDETGPHRLLGEVVISSDRVLVQAPRYRHRPADEMARVLVHGLLHLLGYEHKTTAGRRRMREAERGHLRRLAPWIDRLAERYRSVTP
jgi:probable rRNA maturation factor